jgi:hypothetical protein
MLNGVPYVNHTLQYIIYKYIRYIYIYIYIYRGNNISNHCSQPRVIRHRAKCMVIFRQFQYGRSF